MRFRLVPSNDAFFQLFNEAGSNMATAVDHLYALIHDFSDIQTKHQLVKQAEHRGDELTRTILRQLVTTFVTPFDREDIHELAERLDDVVDSVYHVSEMLVLVPIDRILPEVKEQVDVLKEMSATATSVLGRLAGMKGTHDDIERLDSLESQGDAIYRRTVARLFSGELPALEVLKWKDIVDSVEHALDRLEDVGDVIASIVVKHA